MKKFDIVSETERLLIRPLQEDDYTTWLNGFNNRLPTQHRHDKGKMDMSECTKEWFAHLIKKHQTLALDDTAHIFGVFLKHDGTHIGMIDFSTLTRDDFQWCRMGYMIHNQYWRNGYGKEAVKAAIYIAFHDLKFHRIEAHINTDNAASIHLAKSVGMEFECVRKRFIFEFGEWADHLIYYINNNEQE